MNKNIVTRIQTWYTLFFMIFRKIDVFLSLIITTILSKHVEKIHSLVKEDDRDYSACNETRRG